MFRGNLGLETLALLIVLAVGVTTFFVLPTGWVISAMMASFASYVVLETLLPKIWETPPDGIRYEEEEDEEDET